MDNSLDNLRFVSQKQNFCGVLNEMTTPTIFKTSSAHFSYRSVWVCPKGNMEIANLYFIVDGLIYDQDEPPHGTSNHVGTTTLFGDNGPTGRSSPVTSKNSILHFQI